MKLLRLLTVASAAVVISTGCDSAQQEAIMSPNADVVTASGNSGSTKVEKTHSTKRGYKAEALITSLGGFVAVDGHVLKVPANAVTSPTFFSVQVVEGNVYQLKFKAWRAIDGAAVTQFTRVPLEITYDVSDLENSDPTGLVVVYLQDGTTTGGMEKVATKVNGTGTVTGYLTHFSSYAVAREYSMGVD
jgi:hypothetical protein